MRLRSLLSVLRAADFQDHDRLAGLAGTPSHVKELPALAESLDNGADDADPLVVNHVIDEVGDVQVGFVAG